MRKIVYRLIPLLLLLSTSILAERSGPYLGAGVGFTNYDDGGRLLSVSENTQESLRLYAGAYINDYLSVEADYSAIMKYNATTMSGGAVSEEFSVFSVAVLAHYPIDEYRLDLYAKFGAGQQFWKESGSENHSDNSATMLFGLGFGYRILEMMTLNIGYDLYRFSMNGKYDQEYDMSLGMSYLKVEVQF